MMPRLPGGTTTPPEAEGAAVAAPAPATVTAAAAALPVEAARNCRRLRPRPLASLSGLTSLSCMRACSFKSDRDGTCGGEAESPFGTADLGCASARSEQRRGRDAAPVDRGPGPLPF